MMVYEKRLRLTGVCIKIWRLESINGEVLGVHPMNFRQLIAAGRRGERVLKIGTGGESGAMQGRDGSSLLSEGTAPAVGNVPSARGELTASRGLEALFPAVDEALERIERERHEQLELAKVAEARLLSVLGTPPPEPDPDPDAKIERILDKLTIAEWAKTLTEPYGWVRRPLAAYVFAESFIAQAHCESLVRLRKLAWVCAMIAGGLASPPEFVLRDCDTPLASGAVVWLCEVRDQQPDSPAWVSFSRAGSEGIIFERLEPSGAPGSTT